ncbi:NADH-quinone oxidoreductase subunit 5 [Pirellula sp. SH-Sr6A]|uniref:NADH-quinone oxidoreductase subunit C n=1 Tax=Pirellula sp. SH-Sr6A TaxID=1632865 RepID=UPI00078E8867|nr:NADH-quinone oxidoreductase subunit C [Pirellula sp. SH-Sr6A]AMV32010.1 NADH-quinone oxidoreductase subunit 5 [Pirellula sp. SH-Sr6A]
MAESVPSSSIQERLGSELPNKLLAWSTFQDQVRAVVPAAEILGTLQACKRLGFNQLTDLTCVDLLEYGSGADRFEVVYLLLNVDTGERLTVKTHVNDPDPKLPSATPVWFGADWLEREVYDMYGIVFEGHPNFKRLLLPQEFQSFPMRKDYPVKGRGERHNFPVITRAES